MLSEKAFFPSGFDFPASQIRTLDGWVRSANATAVLVCENNDNCESMSEEKIRGCLEQAFALDQRMRANVFDDKIMREEIPLSALQ